MKTKFFSILIFCLFITFTNAQSKQWKLNSKTTVLNKTELKVRNNLPLKYQVYSLDLEKLEKEVYSNTLKTVELPTANGVQKFTYQENTALSKELALKFPMIKSYIATAIDDSSTKANFSIGLNGLNSVVYTVGKSPYYLDSYSKDNKTYIGYSKEDLFADKSDFECQVEKAVNKQEITEYAQRDSGDNMLRTYRLALACTGEYAQFHLGQQNINVSATDAVKKAAILSAMNTTITRVNAVFMRDLGVKMEIVANNDQLIFLDESTDDLTNGSATTLINESQSKCDNIIGNANYDIGHTFSTGAGGLAGLGVVCISGQKGRGVTGRSQPINDSFDVDFVAHEIGHQFGGNHTFNSTLSSCGSGNRNDATAVEPGSGSTIMAYAGICGAHNLQSNSDDYFHSISIAEMWSTIQSSATCATLTAIGNNSPTADAGADFSIPKSTPFVLKGAGTDLDTGNVLTYNWEQIDTEVGFAIPILSTNTGGAMFRSLPSKESPNRYMPELATVVAGNTSTTWGVLPSVARELNFSLVVRDNNTSGGNTKRDDVVITVTDASAFTVTAPSSAVTWNTGTTQTITWNKGTTDALPINCQNVNIKLSIDGGLTFPVILKSNTPNDGSEDITIPDNASSTARIMVEAADNIFYNVNSTNFTINSVVPTYVINNVTGTKVACNSGNESVSYVLNLDFVNGFSESVSFTTTGQPSGANVSFSPTSINADGNVTMTISNLNGVTSQPYTINVEGNSSTLNQSIPVILNITNSTFSSLTLTTPANNATSVSLSEVLQWNADTNATNYDVEIASDSGFSSVISSGNVTSNTYTSTGLLGDTTYYWRVKPKNTCGEGVFSSTFSFTTLIPSYCDSNYTEDSTGANHISNITFNTINNNSGNDTVDGYQDFSTIVTNVKRGESHQISVTVDTDGYQDQIYVFIDWNRDFTFNKTNERYDLGEVRSDQGTKTLNITVPNDAAFGEIRMRIITEYFDSENPSGDGACSVDHNSGWGETEDYTIIVDEVASIDDLAFNNFNLYPNPTTGAFNLKLEAVNLDKIAVQLFDVRGRLIAKKEYLNINTNFSEKIFFEKASSGLYLIKIINGNQQTTRKLIIE